MKKSLGNAIITLGIGLALNILLGATKLAVGIIADSTSVLSDALNNLSDAAVSVVTIIATYLAARKADHDHPYGHGRYEYIATFILGAVILIVGGEVCVGGIKRAVHPAPVDTGLLLWLTLGLSVGIKSFMAVFYALRARNGSSNSTLRAAAVDSASDAAVTTAVLVCAIIEKYTGALIDGYVSIGISAVIVIFALGILKNTLNRLLGERPDDSLYSSVADILTSAPEVISVHDIMINDYGADNMFAEADAVFPADMSFVDVHAVCDRLERAVMNETGVRLCLHADPEVSDSRLSEISELITGAITPFGASFHDISIDDENKLVRLDIKLPQSSLEKELGEQARAAVRSVVDYDVNVYFDYI